jgi:hypothetical protein
MLSKRNAAKTHPKSDDDLVLSSSSSYNSLDSEKQNVKQNDSAVAAEGIDKVNSFPKDLSDIKDVP